MAGWTTQKELLRMEIKQREEEGCDVRGFAERFDGPAHRAGLPL